MSTEQKDYAELMINTEMEVKVLEVDPVAIAARLKLAGARKVLDAVTYIEGFDFVPESGRVLSVDSIPDRFMPVFDAISAISSGQQSLISTGAYLRLRQEAQRSELILKSRSSKNQLNVKVERELSVPVDPAEWDEIRELLRVAGLERVVIQEKHRTSFVLDSLTVRYDIDTWPGIPTYLEVEATNKARIKMGLSVLGFSMKHATSMTGKGVFEKYNVDPSNLVFPKEGQV